MLLLVGLGNPGPDYAATRHNIGFMAVDAVARRHGFTPWRKRFRGEVAEGELNGTKTLALKPMTYMNNSGEAVAEAARFYKIPTSDIVVLYDEIDLVPGKTRAKVGGGSAGHNGIRSIDAHLDDANYRRIRLGVGHPGDKAAVLHWVLRPFAKSDKIWLDPLLEALAEAAPLLGKGDDAGYMTKVALLTQPPKAGPAKED